MSKDFSDIDAAATGKPRGRRIEDFPVSSRPGDAREGGRKHAGTDYLTPGGTPIAFDEDDEGEVVEAGPKGGYGNLLVIRGSKSGKDHWYGHLQGFDVKVGDRVKRGQEVARTGNTGHVRGAHGGYHVHREDRPSPKPAPRFADIDAAARGTAAPARGGQASAAAPTPPAAASAPSAASALRAGQRAAGNVDLTNRPVRRNEDGSISTVNSKSFKVGEDEVLLPTISDDGRQMTDEEALDQYKVTGRHLGKFDSPENATAYAKDLHTTQEMAYGDIPRYGTRSPKDLLLDAPSLEDERARLDEQATAGYNAGVGQWNKGVERQTGLDKAEYNRRKREVAQHNARVRRAQAEAATRRAPLTADQARSEAMREYSGKGVMEMGEVQEGIRRAEGRRGLDETAGRVLREKGIIRGPVEPGDFRAREQTTRDARAWSGVEQQAPSPFGEPGQVVPGLGERAVARMQAAPLPAGETPLSPEQFATNFPQYAPQGFFKGRDPGTRGALRRATAAHEREPQPWYRGGKAADVALNVGESEVARLSDPRTMFNPLAAAGGMLSAGFRADEQELQAEERATGKTRQELYPWRYGSNVGQAVMSAPGRFVAGATGRYAEDPGLARMRPNPKAAAPWLPDIVGGGAEIAGTLLPFGAAARGLRAAEGAVEGLQLAREAAPRLYAAGESAATIGGVEAFSKAPEGETPLGTVGRIGTAAVAGALIPPVARVLDNSVIMAAIEKRSGKAVYGRIRGALEMTIANDIASVVSGNGLTPHEFSKNPALNLALNQIRELAVGAFISHAREHPTEAMKRARDAGMLGEPENLADPQRRAMQMFDPEAPWARRAGAGATATAPIPTQPTMERAAAPADAAAEAAPVERPAPPPRLSDRDIAELTPSEFIRVARARGSAGTSTDADLRIFHNRAVERAREAGLPTYHDRAATPPAPSGAKPVDRANFRVLRADDGRMGVVQMSKDGEPQFQLVTNPKTARKLEASNPVAMPTGEFETLFASQGVHPETQAEARRLFVEDEGLGRPPKEVPRAREVREDQGPVPSQRGAGGEGEGDRGPDVQQTTQGGRGPGDGTPLVEAPEGRTEEEVAPAAEPQAPAPSGEAAAGVLGRTPDEARAIYESNQIELLSPDEYVTAAGPEALKSASEDVLRDFHRERVERAEAAGKPTYKTAAPAVAPAPGSPEATAAEIANVFSKLGTAAKEAGEEHTRRIVAEKGYVGFRKAAAADLFRADHPDWTETVLDGEHQFRPPAAEPAAEAAEADLSSRLAAAHGTTGKLDNRTGWLLPDGRSVPLGVKTGEGGVSHEDSATNAGSTLAGVLDSGTVRVFVETAGAGRPAGERHLSVEVNRPLTSEQARAILDYNPTEIHVSANPDESGMWTPRSGAVRLSVDAPERHRQVSEVALTRAVREALAGEEPASHKFGTTQVNAPGPVADRVRALGREIPDDALNEDGRENEPHITVLYGLQSPEQIEGLRRIAAGVEPFDVTLGKTSSFPPTTYTKGAAILKVDVTGPELGALHGKIDAAEDVPTRKQDFSKYAPHMTVAYMKPERVSEFEGRADLEGEKIHVDHFVVSDREGKQVEIRLGAEHRDIETRPSEKEWAEMTDDEKYLYAHGDDLTPLGNKKEWKKLGLEEQRKADAGDPEAMTRQLRFDINNFKAINEDPRLGHDAGDALIGHVGTVFSEELIARGKKGHGVRWGGDEFFALGKDPEELGAIGRAVNERLKASTFVVEGADGTTYRVKGLTIGYGVGEGKASAEQALHQGKRAATARGERAPEGAPPGTQSPSLVVEPAAESARPGGAPPARKPPEGEGRPPAGNKPPAATPAAVTQEFDGRNRDTFARSVSLNALARGRAIRVLNAKVGFNGVAMTRGGWVENKVREGYTVVSHAEDGRRLQGPDGAYLAESQLTKTAMDYAEHLLGGVERLKAARPDAEEPASDPRPRLIEVNKEIGRLMGQLPKGETRFAPEAKTKMDALLAERTDLQRQVSAMSPEERAEYQEMQARAIGETTPETKPPAAAPEPPAQRADAPKGDYGERVEVLRDGEWVPGVLDERKATSGGSFVYEVKVDGADHAIRITAENIRRSQAPPEPDVLKRVGYTRETPESKDDPKLAAARSNVDEAGEKIKRIEADVRELEAKQKKQVRFKNPWRETGQALALKQKRLGELYDQIRDDKELVRLWEFENDVARAKTDLDKLRALTHHPEGGNPAAAKASAEVLDILRAEAERQGVPEADREKVAFEATRLIDAPHLPKKGIEGAVEAAADQLTKSREFEAGKKRAVAQIDAIEDLSDDYKKTYRERANAASSQASVDEAVKAAHEQVRSQERQAEAAERAKEAEAERKKDESALAARNRKLDDRYREQAEKLGAGKATATIKIADKRDPKTGDVLSYKDKKIAGTRIGPFVLHAHKAQGITSLTHLGTGRMLFGFRTEAQAKRGAVLALESPVDWGAIKSEADFLAQPKDVLTKLNADFKAIEQNTLREGEREAFEAEHAERKERAKTEGRPEPPLEQEARASRTNKPSARHGLTKPQAEYVAAELAYAVRSGHFAESDAPYEIKVPAGPTYKLATEKAANNFHKMLTGEFIPEAGETEGGPNVLPPAPSDFTPGKLSEKRPDPADLLKLAEGYEADGDPELAEHFRLEADRLEREGPGTVAEKKKGGKKKPPSGGGGAQGSPIRRAESQGTSPTTKGYPGRVAIKAEPGGRRKAPTAIINDFAESIDRHVRVAKTPAKLAGQYFPGSGRINLKRASDLDTAMHETSHALDDQFGIVGQWAYLMKSPYDAELIPHFSIHGSSPEPFRPSDDAKTDPAVMDAEERAYRRYAKTYVRAEGVAEWVTAYLKDPEAARAAAPKFADFFERTLSRDALAKVEQFGKEVRQWEGLSATDKDAAQIRERKPSLFRPSEETSKLGMPTSKGLKKALGLGEGLLDRLGAAVQDVLQPVVTGVRRARAMTGRPDQLPENDAEMLMRLYSHEQAKAEHIIEHGLPGTPGGIKWLLEPADQSTEATLRADIRDANTLMSAERVVEQAGQIRDESARRARAAGEKVWDRADKAIVEMKNKALLVKDRINERHDHAIELARERLETKMATQEAFATGKLLGSAKARADRAKAKSAARILATAEGNITKEKAKVYARQGILFHKVADQINAHRDRMLERVERGRERTQGGVKVRLGGVDARVERITRRAFEITKKIDERFNAYAEGRTATLSGTGALVHHDEAMAIAELKELQANPERFAKAEEMAERYRDAATATLDYMRAGGRITAKQYDDVVKSNQFYTAFNRVMDDTELIGGPPRTVSKVIGTSRNVLSFFRGSTRQRENPYVMLMENTARRVAETDRNKALRAFTEELTTNRAMYEGDVPNLQKIGSRASKGDPNALVVYDREGNKQYWQFSDDIHKSLKGWMTGDDPNLFTKIMRAPGRLIRFTVTHTPAFAARNVQRDAWHRSLVSLLRPEDQRAGKGFVERTFEGSKPTDIFRRQGAEAQAEYKSTGGQGAEYYLSSRTNYYRHMDRTIKELRKDRSTILADVEQIAKLYPRMIHASEMRGRVVEYNRAKKRAIEELGYNEYNARLYATSQANDLLDFSRAGYVVRALNRYIPFTNAAVQGLSKTIRAAKTDPVVFAARVGIYAVLPEIAMYMLNVRNGDEQEYNQQPAYYKDMFYNVKLGPDLWLRMPKAYEVGTLASGVGRMIAYNRGDKHAFAGYPESFLRAILPIDPDAAALGPLRPVIESIVNYDTFRDRYIVPPDEKELDVERRKGTQFASRAGQFLQRLLRNNIDARNIDHWLQTQFGGVGDLAIKASDIGRPDRTAGLREFGMAASGVLVRSPAYSARDFQYLLGRARGLGENQSKIMRDFRDLMKTYQEAKDPATRDKLARSVREASVRVRAYLDQAGTLLNPEEIERRAKSAVETPARKAESDAERRAKYTPR